MQPYQLINLLKEKQIQFEEGLSDIEVKQIEEKFSITFPPDLKEFLQQALPVTNGFVDWRKGLTDQATAANITHRINWPLDGMLFDIKHNTFWEPGWGEKPAEYASQEAIARKFFPNYPKLIPIFSHRYVPSTPNEAGNPIFSIYQTDIIYYGYNLVNYFAAEFFLSLPQDMLAIEQFPKNIEFWSLLAE